MDDGQTDKHLEDLAQLKVEKQTDQSFEPLGIQVRNIKLSLFSYHSIPQIEVASCPAKSYTGSILDQIPRHKGSKLWSVWFSTFSWSRSSRCLSVCPSSIALEIGVVWTDFDLKPAFGS